MSSYVQKMCETLGMGMSMVWPCIGSLHKLGSSSQSADEVAEDVTLAPEAAPDPDATARCCCARLVLQLYSFSRSNYTWTSQFMSSSL